MKDRQKSYLFSIFKENKIFILFSLLSCALPIIYCLFASLIKPNGSQAVMAIGHVMPFLLAFMQISFTISMIMFAKLWEIQVKRLKSSDSIVISALIWMSVFIGFICTICYVVSSFCYMYFSNNRPNTQEMLNYGLDFTWITIPFIFLFPLFMSTIFVIRRIKKQRALLLIFTFFVFCILFSFIFVYFTNLKALGLGLGLSLGLFISLIINQIYIKNYYSILIYSPLYVSEFNKHISRSIVKESMTSISLSLFKGLAIICLSFTIPNTINNFVPLSYQMSRVIWFNMMYFIPFIGIGVGEGIRFHYLSLHGKYHEEDCYLNHRWRNDFKIIFTTFFLTILIAIGCLFLVKPLNDVYTMNDYNTFQHKLMPQIEGWGRPTKAPTNFLNFNELKQLKFDELPEFKELTDNPILNAIIRLENLKLFNDWLQVQITNNKDVLEQIGTDLNSLNEWYEWLNQTNDNGISILQFIETKYNIDFMEEINKVINGGQASEGLLSSIKGSLSYFVYLWLYSSTSPIVTDAFLITRPLIGFESVMNSDASILAILVNNPLPKILTSLFLSINSFEAKAMIYVCVYGIMSAVWSILIQVSQRNNKKGMPYWLMTIIYAVCVGFLVTFGVLFSVTFKDQLGSNNPFMYLDAWTFPLVVISFFVILVLSIKLFVSYKYLDKEREKSLNVRIY